MIAELIEQVAGVDEATGRPMTGTVGLRGELTPATGGAARWDFRVITTGGVQQGTVFFADLLTPDQFRRICEGCGDIDNHDGWWDHIRNMHAECSHSAESAARRNREPTDPDEMRD